jgi:hypothetical protein
MRGGYVEIPEGWERVSADGPGPFVTSEVLRRPDGTEVRWRSRSHRKGRSASPASSGTTPAGGSGEPTWWRPRRRSVLFALGSLCFTVAAIAAQWASVSRPGIGVTFFFGSLLFTSAAYLQFSETVNVEHALESRGRRSRWRPASWEPQRIDWLAASIQLVGTVFFNLSTFAAMKHGLDTHQVNARVWGPDALGSICFLLSSELAYAEVCHRWVCLKLRSLSWRIVSLNLLGSLAFGAAAIASLLEPASGEPISARVVNGGTALGGLCFLVAALALMPEAASEARATTNAASPAADLTATGGV